MQRQRHGDDRLDAGADREDGPPGPDRGRGSDRGDTLVEVLLATLIIAITVSALLGALIQSIGGSVEHRSLATVDTVLRSFAESAKYDIQLQPVVPGVSSPLFTECATSYRVLSSPSPSSGPATTAVTVFGTGYAPNSPLSVAIGSTPVTSVTSGATSDSKGDVALAFAVPAGLTPGQAYPIKVTDASTNSATSTGSFLVTSGTPALTASPLAAYSLGISSIGWWNPVTKVFDPSTGPCQPDDRSGIQAITLSARAADHSTGTVTFSAVNPATTAPSITSAGSAAFTVGTAGSFTVTTTGFPTPALAESGALPSGVTFTDDANGTATLAGTPAAGAGGSYALTFAATSSSGTFSQAFTLTVKQPPAITSVNSTTLTVGTAGSFTLATTGFPTPALTESGALPSGVTFTDNGNGTATVAGTPGAGTAGPYPLTVTATSSAGTAGQTFTLAVNQAPAITSANTTTFTVGAAGSFTVTSSGVPTPALSESGALPSGVTFNTATGVLSGTPAAGAGGTYSITFTASNGVNPNATQTFTLIVRQAPAFTSASAAMFTVGTAGSLTATTSGLPTPALNESGALPSGVTFTDNGNGTATLAGTPGAGTGGTYTLTLKATNALGSATQTFTLTVNQAPAITSANSTTFTNGLAGTFTVTATGFPTPTLSESGSLPKGVTFNAATGVLSGTPAKAGTYVITFTASNGVDPTSTQTFTLTVN
jgi:type II secretory pathway pseudopilin PulG